MKYAYVELGSDGHDTGAAIGLCLPAACSDDFITKSIDSALKIVQPGLSVYFINTNT